MHLLSHATPIPIRGPRAVPLLGVRGSFFRFYADPVGNLLRLQREYGDLVALVDRNPALLFAFGPEHNQQVLSDANLFQNNEAMFFSVPKESGAERLLVNLVMHNGPTHRRHRRLMMPAFHRGAVEGYREDIVAIAERYLGRWTPGRAVDLADEMKELTLEIALKCFFDLESTPDPDNLGRLGTEHLDGLTSPGVMMLPYDLPGTPYRRFLNVSQRLEARLLRLMREKRARPLEGQRDAFALLLQARDEDGAGLTETELLGEAGLLFIAGHETTAYTLTWTLFLLAQHPKVFADLVDELASKLRGGAPSLAQLAELPLLDAVVKESMRLLPVVPMLFIRLATAGFQLGGVELPKGAALVLSPLTAHRRPELFPEPDRFKPERWQGLQPATYEYIPFGAGPRMCIGASFAQLALRVLLAMIVQRHRVALVPNARIDRAVRGVTFGPKRGVPATVWPQDRRFDPPPPLRGDVLELYRRE